MKNNFKILSPREKILLRPARVIGDITTSKKTKYYIDGDVVHMDEIYYNPGLNKIIREVIDNSIDEYIRTKGDYSNKIEITITDLGEVTIKDNGRGIPIDYTIDPNGEKVMIPEAAWTRIDAGSNYDDEEDNTTIGQNGEGAALTNTFSVKFMGETTNNSKTFVLTCEDNMNTIDTKIKNTKKPVGTKVTFTPDYKRFGEDNLPKGNLDVLKYELLHIAMNYPNLKINLNKNPIKVKNLKDYASLYGSVFETYETKGMKIVVLPNNEDNFRFVHFINGINVHNGGTMLDWVTRNIVNKLHEKYTKRRMYKDLKQGDIKNKLMIVSLFDGIYNPRFADQIKSECVNTFAEFSSQIGDYDFEKFSNKIARNSEIVDPILVLHQLQAEKDKILEMKKLEKKGKKKPKDDKFLQPVGDWESIMLCEGDSSRNNLSSILGRENMGFYAMFGVPPNAYDMTIDKVLKSDKMKSLQHILGLKYSTTIQDSLNFNRIIIASDEDGPGHFINGILIGLFFRFGRNLIKENRIYILKTPLFVCVDKNEKIVDWFYDFKTQKDFEKKNQNKGYTYNYKKGLSSWNPEELQTVISSNGIEDMIGLVKIENEDKDSETIDSWLNKKRANDRKNMLEGFTYNIHNT